MIQSLCKTIIVLWASFLWLGGWFFTWSMHVWQVVYATAGVWSSTVSDQSDIEWEDRSDFLETADLLMRFLSWAWIVPASIAGELMTNEVIYGKSFYLSEVLFKFWQFIRTLALYALGFLMVYKVWETFAKWGDVSSLWSTTVKALAAWALIPMSWRLVAAVIDVSLIATAAVSALPLNAMEQLRTQLSLEGKISCSKTVYIKDFQVQPETDLPNNTQELTFRDLVPAGDSVAWSMVFLWCWLLRLDQSMHLVNQEWEWINKTADQISSTFIRLIMVVMLVVPMFVLVVMNVIRIIFIRLRIITVPFIILAYVFDIGWIKDMEYFKLWNIIWLIFQPVVVVGTLSVWVLIIMGMYGALLGDEQTINQWMWELINVYVDSDRTARIWTNWPAESIINGDMFGQTWDILWGWIWRMIVTFFMVFLFRALIKIWFSTSALTKWVSDSIFNFASQIASTVPIVPVPWLWLQSVSSINKSKESFNRNSPMKNLIYKDKQRIMDFVNEKTWNTSPELRNEDYTQMKSEAIKPWLWLWKTIKQFQKAWKPITIRDVKKSISEWIAKPSNSSSVKKIFPGISFPSSSKEIEKMWSPENDDTYTDAATFRKYIDGILTDRNLLPEWADESLQMLKKLAWKWNREFKQRY